MRTFGFLALGLAAVVIGCTDKDDSNDSDVFQIGFTLEGSVLNFWDGTVSPENMCITLYDPDDLVYTGGPLIEIDDTTVASDGTFSMSEILTTAQLGLLMMADDCDGGDAYMGLATGIPSDTINALDYGDTLADQFSYYFPNDLVGTFDESLALAGYTGGSLNDVGGLMGWVIDGSDATTAGPVDCAEVYNTSESITTTCYYADTDHSDGIFTTGGVANTQSAAAAGAYYICPEAPIGIYSATDCTNSKYYGITGGSQPGLAQFLRIPKM